MVTKDGVAKLADLGLARRLDAEETALTRTGTAMGTPYYMAPEQASDAKRVDARADIYALGATWYHMVTGQVPFNGVHAARNPPHAHEGAGKEPPGGEQQGAAPSRGVEDRLFVTPSNRASMPRGSILHARSGFRTRQCRAIPTGTSRPGRGRSRRPKAGMP